MVQTLGEVTLSSTLHSLQRPSIPTCSQELGANALVLIIHDRLESARRLRDAGAAAGQTDKPHSVYIRVGFDVYEGRLPMRSRVFRKKLRAWIRPATAYEPKQNGQHQGNTSSEREEAKTK